MKKGVFTLIAILSLLVIGFSYFYYNSEVLDTSSASDNTITPPEEKAREVENQYNSDGIYVYAFKNKIDVYYKGSNDESNNYLGYHIRRTSKDLNVEENASNYDVWNISSVNEFERTSKENFLTLRNVVTNGEWDIALMEQGANDFVGGTLHGDEITTDYQLFIDEEEIDLDSVNELSAEKTELIVESDLYRDNTTTEEPEKIAVRQKVYTLTEEGLMIDQQIEFEESLNLDKSYLAMLPILRNSNGETGEQITDKITTSYDDEVYDVSEPEFNIPEVTNVNADYAEITGKDSGINATVEILEKSHSELPTIFHVAKSPLYNKLYFAFNEEEYITSVDEVWSQTTYYTINTIN